MPQATPLPDGLVPPFSVATARHFGMSDSRLRRKDLSRPFHGVRSVDHVEADDGEESSGSSEGTAGESATESVEGDDT